MELVTIVSDELSKEKVQSLQEEADRLVCMHNYSAHAIMHHLGLRQKLCVSLYSENGQITMSCRKKAK